MAPCTWQMCPSPYEHTSPFRPMNGLTAHCNWQQGRLHQDPGKHTCLPSVSSPKTANHPILLRSHSTRESAQSPGESGVDLQQPDWCPRSECWRNSGSYPLQSSNSTGCKWRPLHASQHPMPPRDPTVRHNTSSSSAGPVSTGRGPACSSSRLAQLSSECVAGIRKASRGKGSPPLGGSSFSMRNVEKNGCSTHSRPSLNNGGSTYYPLSTPTPPPQSPVLPGGRNALRSIEKECMPHCPLGHITWHPWARMAAAAFRILGGTLASLADWGRWKDLKQARHYAKAPADWSLPEFLSLPYPESFTGFPSRDMGGVSIRTKDVWPREAWEKRTGPRKPPPKPAPESVKRQKPRGTAGENRGAKPDQSDSSEDSSSSGDSSDEGMEVDEDTTNPPPPPDVADAGAGTTEPAAATAPTKGRKTAPSSWMTPEMASSPPKWAPQVLMRGDQTRGSTGWRGKEQLRQNPPQWSAPEKRIPNHRREPPLQTPVPHWPQGMDVSRHRRRYGQDPPLQKEQWTGPPPPPPRPHRQPPREGLRASPPPPSNCPEGSPSPGRKRPHKRLFALNKRPHVPSGETPYPADKVPMVQNPLPPPEPRDTAPHSGYDVCAPMRHGRFLHWVPGQMLLPAPGEAPWPDDKEDPKDDKESLQECRLQVPENPGDSWVVAGLGCDHTEQVLGRGGRFTKPSQLSWQSS